MISGIRGAGSHGKAWSIGDLKILPFFEFVDLETENGLPVSMLLTIVALFEEKELRAVGALSPLRSSAISLYRHGRVALSADVIKQIHQPCDVREFAWRRVLCTCAYVRVHVG